MKIEITYKQWELIRSIAQDVFDAIQKFPETDDDGDYIVRFSDGNLGEHLTWIKQDEFETLKELKELPL